MSYIDCFDHEYIGSLGYLPIYHPLEEIKGGGWGHYDFSASTTNLILGGGGGEHPALVVHKPESLAATFLYHQLSDEQADSLSKSESDYLIDIRFPGEILEFCGWTIRQMATLKEMAESVAFITPLQNDEDVEDWICKSLGELVFYSLPELNPEQERLVALFSRFPIYAAMRNVACTPPGYPKSGGRVIVDGKLEWGRSRWDLSRQS